MRKEKGLTQEQLAEILFVSGRTVSRWETGTNMPELSILMQMAEFYHVEIKEILDGERKGETMNQEIKETLSKVADYNKLEKEKVIKAGNTAFGLAFIVCTATIMVQLIVMGTLLNVVGETVTLFTGGIAYIGLMIHSGVWETGSKFQSKLCKDIWVSVICSALFTAALVLCYMRLGAGAALTAQMAVLFFAGTAILGFTVLRILSHCNQKKRETGK